MAIPALEFQTIADRLRFLSSNLIEQIRDEIITGRATGVPDEVTLQRLKEQQVLGQGATRAAANKIVDATLGRLQSMYSSTQAEMAAGLEKPSTLYHVLPEEAGYTATP